MKLIQLELSMKKVKNIETRDNFAFFRDIQDQLIFQSIGSRPLLSKNSFTLEKWRHPKKPEWAERGEGWAAVKAR